MYLSQESRALLIAVIVAVLPACSDNDDDPGGSSGSRGTASVEPVAANIKTTVPLAYAASVAMAEVQGIDLPDANASNQCGAYPCVSVVNVVLSPGDLPIELDEYGDVQIAGLWTSPDHAVLTMSFNGIRIGSPNNLAINISTFPVVRDGDSLLISYASIDVNIDGGPEDPAGLSGAEIAQELGRVNTPVSNDPEINVNMDAWIITVDTQGTAEPDDDSYSVSGGGQYIGVRGVNVSVIQLGVVDMLVTGNCALNPVDGMAVLNELDTAQAGFPKIGTAIFQFQSGCTGTARILTAIGTYGIFINDNIALNL
jgi:hypothetical protein